MCWNQVSVNHILLAENIFIYDSNKMIILIKKKNFKIKYDIVFLKIINKKKTKYIHQFQIKFLMGNSNLNF